MVTLNNRYLIRIGTQKGTIISRTTHLRPPQDCNRTTLPWRLLSGSGFAVTLATQLPSYNAALRILSSRQPHVRRCSSDTFQNSTSPLKFMNHHALLLMNCETVKLKRKEPKKRTWTTTLFFLWSVKPPGKTLNPKPQIPKTPNPKPQTETNSPCRDRNVQPGGGECRARGHWDLSSKLRPSMSFYVVVCIDTYM